MKNITSMSTEIVRANKIHPAISTKKDNQIFIGTSITAPLFNPNEMLETGFVYNIGYDQITLALEEDTGSMSAASTIKNLNDYDKTVYDAVCSLSIMLRQKLKNERLVKTRQLEEEGYDKDYIDSVITSSQYTIPVFSSRQIYQVMTGEKKIGSNPTAESIANVEESIDKLCSMSVDIVYNNPSNEKLKNQASAHLLQLTRMIAHMPSRDKDGNIVPEKVKYYRLESDPILYQYAIFKEKLSILPSELIKTKSIYKTKTNLIIQSYMINKILDIGFVDAHNVILNCNELYSLVDSLTSVKKKRTRDIMFRILDDWTETGFIDLWEICEYSKGKRQTPLAVMVSLTNNFSYASILNGYNKRLEAGEADET